MSKKFKRVNYPEHMLREKIKKIIVQFLDEHEATICAEDLSSEFWKQHLANALTDDLIKQGVEITYLKKIKDDRENRTQ